jgi:uncharacterized membrane protein
MQYLGTQRDAPPAAGTMTRYGHRLWEVDLARGIAVVMMVLYHLMWDLSYFKVADVDVYAGFWHSFARTTATLFLLLVGLSLHLSSAKAGAISQHGAALWRRQVKRGLTIFAWGLVITLATWLFLGEGFVRFGILHLIGASVILSYPFVRLGAWNLVLGIIVIIAGLWLRGLTVDFPWLLWLGLQPRDFTTVDYFPLLPWFGVVLIGLSLGALLYPAATRRFPLPDLATLPPVPWLALLGRHALVIYLLHQPALIALLVVLGVVDSGLLVAG